ncbi:MAG: hypothetical protein KGQ66_02280 [Acidobacteriota bacterium]|nr:hypothetical protein [Acidobacteriota bacterium]
MAEQESLIAERVVDLPSEKPLNVKIWQHVAEGFWRVDVGRHGGPSWSTTTVGDGDSFMMNLISAALSDEALAWRHLAQWGRDITAHSPRPAPLIP